MLLLLFALPACDDDDDSTGPDPVATGTIRISFEERIDGAIVQHWNNDTNNIIYDNDAGNTYGVDVLEYLVGNFGVLGTAKLAQDFDVAHYRNAFDASTEDLTLEDVEVGSYDALTFWWGVPDPLNTGSVSDAGVPRGLPGEFDFLLWPMGTAGGYHCMRFEGPYNKAGVGDGNFTLHMGRLRTPDDRTTNGHQRIVLPFNFDVVEDQTFHIILVMNVNDWMHDPEIDLTATAGGMPLDGPTMMNHAAQELMRDNAQGVFGLDD